MAKDNTKYTKRLVGWRVPLRRAVPDDQGRVHAPLAHQLCSASGKIDGIRWTLRGLVGGGMEVSFADGDDLRRYLVTVADLVEVAREADLSRALVEGEEPEDRIEPADEVPR